MGTVQVCPDFEVCRAVNGRCSNDPIDLAVDLCMFCGDEFCARCMVYPQGEKRPGSCRICAVRASGLRGKHDGGHRVSKRTIKKRRTELAEAAELAGGTDGFRFFDDPDSGFELSGPLTEPVVDEPKKRRLPRLRRRSSDEGAAAVSVDDETTPVDHGTAHDEAAHDETVHPVDATVGDVDALGEAVGFDEFLGDDAPAPDAAPGQRFGGMRPDDAHAADADAPTPAERQPSATELLARLREAQETGPDLSAFVDEPSEAVPAHAATPTPGPTHAPTPAAAPPMPAPAAPVASLDESPFGAPAPPPVVQPESDPWVPAASSTPTVVDTAPSAAPDLAVNPFGPGPEADGAADTDAGGNWIPPALRGMAPEAERGALPRRRSDD